MMYIIISLYTLVVVTADAQVVIVVDYFAIYLVIRQRRSSVMRLGFRALSVRRTFSVELQ